MECIKIIPLKYVQPRSIINQIKIKNSMEFQTIPETSHKAVSCRSQSASRLTVSCDPIFYSMIAHFIHSIHIFNFAYLFTGLPAHLSILPKKNSHKLFMILMSVIPLPIIKRTTKFVSSTDISVFIHVCCKHRSITNNISVGMYRIP